MNKGAQITGIGVFFLGVFVFGLIGAAVVFSYSLGEEKGYSKGVEATVQAALVRELETAKIALVALLRIKDSAQNEPSLLDREIAMASHYVAQPILEYFTFTGDIAPKAWLTLNKRLSATQADLAINVRREDVLAALAKRRVDLLDRASAEIQNPTLAVIAKAHRARVANKGRAGMTER